MSATPLAGLQPARICGRAARIRGHLGVRALSSYSHDAECLATTVKVHSLIRLFREHGHCIAKQDPLHRPRWKPVEAPSLALFASDAPVSSENLTAAVGAPLSVDDQVFIGNELLGGKTWWRMGDVITFLKSAYCGSIGVEYMHLANGEHRSWWRERFERVCDRGEAEHHLVPHRSADAQRRSFELLLEADRFEHALATRFPAAKRFGLEGGEVLMPALHALVQRAADLGVNTVELGTSHRGRLNLLHGLLGKPFGHICAEFADDGTHPHVGDVRYHLGTTGELVTPNGGRVHLSLSPNPSHLEAVNPVVLGGARAKQDRLAARGHARADAARRVMPLLLHGDAAFAGQGLVAETLQLCGLDDYSTGGSVHVVLNNQIGFTTNPQSSRSTRYPTDVGKVVSAPILHVNADDVEACVRALELAAEWRQHAQQDVIIDLVGARSPQISPDLPRSPALPRPCMILTGRAHRYNRLPQVRPQ